MNGATHATIAGWANFYLITGSAAAALTGLQFVVQTLIASDALRSVGGSDPETTIAAFGTPTVVHLTLALVLSALLCVPWPGITGLRESLGALGVAALLYSVAVLRRALRVQNYVPVFEDWLCHVVLPVVAYGAVLVSALLFSTGMATPLFVIAAATLLLLCVGIHNAWDTVTYLSVRTMIGADAAKSAPVTPRNDASSRGKRRR
jgi:hypothetical protein